MRGAVWANSHTLGLQQSSKQSIMAYCTYRLSWSLPERGLPCGRRQITTRPGQLSRRLSMCGSMDALLPASSSSNSRQTSTAATPCSVRDALHSNDTDIAGMAAAMGHLCLAPVR